MLPDLLGWPFGLLSALRGSRVFHPQGFVCSGTWTIERGSKLAPGALALAPGQSFDVVARASRGAGLPDAVGDVYGIAVRLLDVGRAGRHQDVLANTSLDLPLAHHLFLPAPHWYAQAYSTCLPYAAGAGPFVLGWLPPHHGTTPGPGLDAMRDEVREGRATFGIGIASAPLGRFSRIGTLTLDTLEDREISFDPIANVGGGIQPVGVLNALRGPAYRASQLGRGVPQRELERRS